MHVGFYSELDELRAELEDETADFGYLESVSSGFKLHLPTVSGTEVEQNITAYDFLHGNCDIFAEALHKEYGYPVFVLNDEDNNLVHCFCRIETPNNSLYIDVRGTTDNFNEFVEEFEDFVNADEASDYIAPLFGSDFSQGGYISEKYHQELLDFSNEIIKDYPSYFNADAITKENRKKFAVER